MNARFAFHSPEFSVEFHGSEEFVTAQIDLVRSRILNILREACGEPEEAVARTPEVEGEKPTLEEYFHAARVREGRGALQDSILIFAHYMQAFKSKHEFSIEDLNFCFDLLDIQRPKSLANTLGIIKRDRKLLHSGSRRGMYSLSDRGMDKVKRLTR